MMAGIPLFEGKFYLESYQFHYIMLPELAPEEDTWRHEKQMRFMEDVLSGDAEAYSPQLSDKNVKKILQNSPKVTISFSTADNKTFYTDWKAPLGRLFFKVKTDKGYTDNSVYSMRAHCSHVEMRSCEHFKFYFGFSQLKAAQVRGTHPWLG